MVFLRYPSKQGLFGVLFFVALWLIALPVKAVDKVKVVATFSVLGDMVKEVGQQHVQIKTLVGADGDAHIYQPSPRDAGAVAKADLVVLNGLGFEGWIERLLEASHYKGEQVVATRGIIALKSAEASHDDEAHHDNHHGEWDPHAWHSIDNAVVYVRNIAAGLSKADPAHKADYQRNAETYIASLHKLGREIEGLFEDVPEAKRKVITPHDAFGYFAHAYHIDFIAPQGNSTESEAAAGDVAQIIRQIRAENIKAVFIENVSDSRLMEQISRETGATIGGALYSDALSSANGPAGTYLKMMSHNAHALANALGHKD